MDPALSQLQFDQAFEKARDDAAEYFASNRYDFSRTDRIAKDQIRAIHLLHDSFARSLASNLSAYLRSYVIVNLISVEQLSFRKFKDSLPSPTCLVTLGMKPYDGSSLLEINPSLIFPILEMLLGGTGQAQVVISREITEIEQSVLGGLIRVVLNDLRSAWLAVASIEFSAENQATEPQLVQILNQEEAVVAVSLEVRIGDTCGLMNLGIPSIILKMLRQKFDQHRNVRKTQASEEEHARVLRLIRPAAVELDARLHGPQLGFAALLELKAGDILNFDYPVERPLDLVVNGALKYTGEIVAAGGKRVLQIQGLTQQD